MSVSGSTYLAVFGVGSTVLERVLLSIIEAHPSSELESCPVVRLQHAMEMLLGRSPKQWEAFDKALAFMARERQRDVCDADMSMLATGSGMGTSAARSVLELAEIAARDVLGLTRVSEIGVATNFLCHAYGRNTEFRSVEYDPSLEAMQDEAVRRILAELAEWGIPGVARK